MKFLSLCSGIEAASVAWTPLGWKAIGFSEIAAFPSAVLAHHYPDVPNHGDINTFREWTVEPVDLVCGGTPCQAFSVAGLRQGLADPRGNLALTFLAVVDRYRPRWVVWENVPGVLSSDGGRDFAAFLGGLGQLGYGWSYRVLDAQWCRVDGFPHGVPQRRRRVFVVGYLGDWRPAAAVLFEPESVLGDTPPRRKAGKGFATDVAPSLVGSGRGVERAGESRGQDSVVAVAPTLSTRYGEQSGNDVEKDGALVVAFGGNNTSGPIEVATAVRAHGGPHGHIDFESETFIAHAFDARQTDVVQYGAITGPLDTDGYSQAVAHTLKAEGFDASEDGSGRGTPIVPAGHVVRRLTPRECERLQGFPDDYTAIRYRGKLAADVPRYQAIGNSWAVNVARWIGRRIEMVEEIKNEVE